MHPRNTSLRRLMNSVLNPPAAAGKRPTKKKSSQSVARARRTVAHRRTNPPATTTDQPTLCYDAVAGVLQSGDPALNGVEVQLQQMDESTGLASVILPDGRQVRIPLCGPRPLAPMPVPLPEQPPLVPIPTGTCCVDIDAMRLVCTNPNDPRNGAEIVDVEKVHDDGLVSLTWREPTTGGTRGDRFKLCDPPDDDCCFNAVTEKIECYSGDKHPLHGKPAKIVKQDVDMPGEAYVCFGPKNDETCLRMPLCPDSPPGNCCFDAVNGILVPVNADERCPYAGLSPVIVREGVDESGNPYVVVQHMAINEGNRTVFPLCPEAPPPDCCYDVAQGTLRCPGSPTLDGQEPSLEHMTDVMPDGKIYAVVSHPGLPGGKGQFLLCEDLVPGDCCYNGETGLIECPSGGSLHGTPAGVVVDFKYPDGTPGVSVAWPGGGARMPLCTPTCPPSFCCVNVQTMTFVCPGSPLNGQPADVSDVFVDADGFSYAVLGDGTRVPTCGKKCPPPKLCPPGLWMSPDGKCVDPPTCIPCAEDCPPGQWKDPDGICRTPHCEPCGDKPRFPPKYPEDPRFPPRLPPGGGGGNGCLPIPCGTLDPWWGGEGYCCEKCALGLPCGDGGDCGCGGDHSAPKAANPAHDGCASDACSNCLKKGGRWLEAYGACIPASEVDHDSAWYPASYGRGPRRGAWVKLQKGKRVGILHTSEGMFAVTVKKLRNVKGKKAAKVQGVQRAGLPVKIGTGSPRGPGGTSTTGGPGSRGSVAGLRCVRDCMQGKPFSALSACWAECRYGVRQVKKPSRSRGPRLRSVA